VPPPDVADARAATRPLHRQVSGSPGTTRGHAQADIPTEEAGERARHLTTHAPAQAIPPAPQGKGDDTMGKVLEVPEETYDQLADLARRQQRPVDEMLRLCLAAYEEILYERAHQQMLADGVLVSLPAPPLLPGEVEEDDDFEPVELPGTPLSEIILEDRR
jgi:hypothetical protein